MTKPPPEAFAAHISRLEYERQYVREGFRVPVRIARVPTPPKFLALKAWLLHPLLTARV
jgi:hypothetical protein